MQLCIPVRPPTVLPTHCQHVILKIITESGICDSLSGVLLLFVLLTQLLSCRESISKLLFGLV